MASENITYVKGKQMSVMSYANNEDPDLPTRSCSLIMAFYVRGYLSVSTDCVSLQRGS